MRWESLQADGSAPQARSSHSLTSAAGGTHLLLWGGENAPRVPVDTDIWVFDTASRTWDCPRVCGEAPSARLGHVAAAVGDAMFVHGGRSEVAETSALSDLFSFTPATATWTRVSTSGVAPPRRNFHAACSQGGSLYVFGGCGDAGRLADLWRFDPGSAKWEELPASAAIKARSAPCSLHPCAATPRTGVLRDSERRRPAHPCAPIPG
jgi:N-acetylneuraminic acid mutarotase